MIYKLLALLYNISTMSDLLFATRKVRHLSVGIRIRGSLRNAYRLFLRSLPRCVNFPEY